MRRDSRTLFEAGVEQEVLQKSRGVRVGCSSIFLPQLVNVFGACDRSGPVFPPFLPHQLGLECAFLLYHVRPPQELRVGDYGDTLEFCYLVLRRSCFGDYPCIIYVSCTGWRDHYSQVAV